MSYKLIRSTTANGGIKEIHYLAEFELQQKFEKEKKDTNKKIKRFLTKSKGCRDKEICYWSTM